MKKILLGLLLVILIIFTINTAYKVGKNIYPNTEKEWDKYLEDTVNEMNKKLPNKGTTIKNVKLGPGKKITIIYSTMYKYSEIGKESVIKLACSSENSYLINNGLAIGYLYYDNNGKYLGEIEVTQADCLNN